MKILSNSIMGNNYSIPGYYKLAEVDDFEHIIPHVFSEEDDEAMSVSSQETLRSKTMAGKKSSIHIKPSRYRTTTSAQQVRPGSGRSRKTRRRPLKKKPLKYSMKNTESSDFRALNSLVCNKTPIVLAFLASETKLSVKKHRNPRNSADACSRCKKATRDCANEFYYERDYRSQQCQDSKYSKHNYYPCVRYCKSCKMHAFPCVDYCRACCKSASRKSSHKKMSIVNENSGSYHRHHPPSGRSSPRTHINIFD